MSKKIIKKDYEKKIKLIQKLNESYFDKNKSLVPDKDYDLLNDKLIHYKYFNLKYFT